jgi:potassium-transporting ATPase KdpC subunit
MIREQIRPALFSFVLLTLITGVLYPLSVTGIAKVFFQNQAEGSLILKNGKAVGSGLIGQPFDAPRYLWGRPSATSPVFNASSSSGSNYGPLHADYLKAVGDRAKALKDADPSHQAHVPVDLVTASGSGLDPQISLAGAYYQVSRIARTRGMSEDQIKKIIEKNTQGRFLGLLGEPAVNVLKVNLDLDEVKK